MSCILRTIPRNLVTQRFSIGGQPWRKASYLVTSRKAENVLLQKCSTTVLFDKRYTSTEHSHSGLWAAEKILSAGLLAVIPAAVMMPMPAFDYLLALALVTHIHWGVEAIVVDYIRPSIFGNVIPKVSILLLYALSILSLGGLCYFNYTDVGVAHGLKMLLKV